MGCCSCADIVKFRTFNVLSLFFPVVFSLFMIFNIYLTLFGRQLYYFFISLIFLCFLVCAIGWIADLMMTRAPKSSIRVFWVYFILQIIAVAFEVGLSITQLFLILSGNKDEGHSDFAPHSKRAEEGLEGLFVLLIGLLAASALSIILTILMQILSLFYCRKIVKTLTEELNEDKMIALEPIFQVGGGGESDGQIVSTNFVPVFTTNTFNGNINIRPYEYSMVNNASSYPGMNSGVNNGPNEVVYY